MESTEFKIEGMTCTGCVRSVTKAIERVPGVTRVEVLLEIGLARVGFNGLVANRDLIRKAIVDAGYDTSQ